MTIIRKQLNVYGNKRDEPFIHNNGFIIDVSDDPDSASFKSKQKILDPNRK